MPRYLNVMRAGPACLGPLCEVAIWILRFRSRFARLRIVRYYLAEWRVSCSRLPNDRVSARPVYVVVELFTHKSFKNVPVRWREMAMPQSAKTPGPVDRDFPGSASSVCLITQIGRDPGPRGASGIHKRLAR